MPALLSRLAFIPIILLLFLHSASAQPTSLWGTISQNASFSVLSNCVRQADPAIFALLNDTGGSQLYTLFAPLDSAFAAAGTDATVCPDGDRDAATALLSYLLSSQTTPLPYLNQPFALPLERNVPDAVAALYVYSISKDAATSPALPPILYVNNAQALSWEAVPTPQGGNHYLVPLASPLTPPPGNGSLWDVLQAHPDFSTTVALITAQLPDFQALLQASPDVVSHKRYHTFFVPNNEAWTALPPDRLARLQSDDQALETLLLFHTLSNTIPSSDYPRSTTGMYYSQQFYPTSSQRARDIYQAFYSALSSFTGLRLPNDLGILLDISRLSGTLHLQSNSTAVLLPDLSAYNGVAHGLSGVLPLPEAIPAVVASPPPSLAAAGNFTILSILMQAAVSSGAAPELANGGPFTYLAPTDSAFAAAFEEGRLPRLPVLLQDLERVVSLCRYWALNSTEGLLLFRPDPYVDPFRDDFVDGARLEDGEGRAVWVKRLVVEGSTSLDGKVDDIVVFLNNARLYQCLEGKGIGHACGTRPTPSNTYSINDDRVVNMVHALDAVPLPPSAGTLLQALQQDPDLSSFLVLLLNSPTNADLIARLNTTITNSSSSSEGELFTLWAPTNDALAALQAARPWLFASSEAVDEILRYHLTPHLWYSRWLGPAQPLPTFAFDGEALVLVNAATAPAPAAPAVAFQINRIEVLESDLPASNGVLHKLSGVLVPDLLQIAYSSGGLQRTVAALEGEGEGEDSLAQVLAGPGPFTLFGPLDSVFEAADAAATTDVAARSAAAEGRRVSLTSTELQYHVGTSLVQPEDILINDETVTMVAFDSLLGLPLYLSFVNATISHPYAPSQSGLFVNQAELRLPVHRALNGLVYAVDAFLQSPTQSIMALLRGQEDGRAFASLLTQTGLHTQLEGEGEGGPWTVFAPRTAVLEGLYLKEDIWADIKQAPQLLAFHLVSGRRLFTPAFSNVTSCIRNSEDFCLGPPDIFSLQGQPLSTQVVSKSRTFLSTVHGAFTASLVHPDLHASNGVVHFLDGVLTYDGYQRPTAGTTSAGRYLSHELNVLKPDEGTVHPSMRPDSVRRSPGQRSRPPAPPLSPSPHYMATSIPIPFYPSSLRPPTNQQRQGPFPAPTPPAHTPAPLLPVPMRPRQATRAHVKVKQRFALPAELRAVLLGMPPPKRPRLIAPARRSSSGKDDNGGDRKRRRPASLTALHPPLSMTQCAAVPPDVVYLENVMARISLGLQDIHQELRSQHHLHYAPALAPLTCDMAAAPSYRVLSTAAASSPSPEKEEVMKRHANDNSSNSGSRSSNSNSSSSSSSSSNSTPSSRNNGGPRFTVRTANGTEVVLDNGGVDSRMVEILVGDLTGVCCTAQQTHNMPRFSTPSPLRKVAVQAATTQDACTSPSMPLLPTQAGDAMCGTEESSVASAASSISFQNQGVLHQRAPPIFYSCPSLKVETSSGTDEVDDENHDHDNGDAHSSPVRVSTDLSLASLPVEWPVPAPSPLPSQSPHCFSSPESCFSPFVPEGRSVEDGSEKVVMQEEEQNQEQEQETSISKSSRSTSRCSSSCCDCSFSSMLVAGDGDEDGYNTDSSTSTSSSSYSLSSSSSSSSSSSLYSSSSSTISACCRTVLERDVFTASSTCPVRLLRW